MPILIDKSKPKPKPKHKPVHIKIKDIINEPLFIKYINIKYPNK